MIIITFNNWLDLKNKIEFCTKKEAYEIYHKYYVGNKKFLSYLRNEENYLYLIYKITNNITQQIYIGLTKNIYTRMKGHVLSAFKPNNYMYNKPLYEDIRNIGITNFSIEIIDSIVGLNSAKILEREWIEKLHAFRFKYPEENNYNLSSGGEGLSLNKEEQTKVVQLFESGNTIISIVKNVGRGDRLITKFLIKYYGKEKYDEIVSKNYKNACKNRIHWTKNLTPEEKNNFNNLLSEKLSIFKPTEEQKIGIIEKYKNGSTLRKLAEEYQVSAYCISTVIKKYLPENELEEARNKINKTIIKSKRTTTFAYYFTDEQIKNILKLRENGYSWRKLGREFNCDPSVIQRILKPLISDAQNEAITLNSQHRYDLQTIKSIRQDFITGQSKKIIATKYNIQNPDTLNRILNNKMYKTDDPEIIKNLTETITQLKNSQMNLEKANQIRKEFIDGNKNEKLTHKQLSDKYNLTDEHLQAILINRIHKTDDKELLQDLELTLQKLYPRVNERRKPLI